MSQLFHIVYASTASETFSRDDLKEMIKGSVRRNKLAGITGLLLFKGGCFMQAMEGEEATVEALFAKISRAPRHHNVIPLIQEPTGQRDFPDSAMALRDIRAADLRTLPGYSEFLNTPLNGELYAKHIPKCKKLLLLFKKNIR